MSQSDRCTGFMQYVALSAQDPDRRTSQVSKPAANKAAADRPGFVAYLRNLAASPDPTMRLVAEDQLKRIGASGGMATKRRGDPTGTELEFLFRELARMCGMPVEKVKERVNANLLKSGSPGLDRVPDDVLVRGLRSALASASSDEGVALLRRHMGSSDLEATKKG